MTVLLSRMNKTQAETLAHFACFSSLSCAAPSKPTPAVSEQAQRGDGDLVQKAAPPRAPLATRVPTGGWTRRR
jgi:hypothetical protein